MINDIRLRSRVSSRETWELTLHRFGDDAGDAADDSLQKHKHNVSVSSSVGCSEAEAGAPSAGLSLL